VSELLARIHAPDDELETELRRQQDRVLDDLRQRRTRLEASVQDAQSRAKVGLRRWLKQSQPQSFLSIPFIYGMAIPLAFLGVCLTFYQRVCLSLYRIERMKRADFIVIDRQHLAYLNAIEKAHCVYCGYANGVLAYGVEIAARTEQYWCLIKHAHRAQGTHARAEHFLAYGNAADFAEGQERLRHELAPASGDPAGPVPNRSLQ
jgi:hypothetical protein